MGCCPRSTVRPGLRRSSSVSLARLQGDVAPGCLGRPLLPRGRRDLRGSSRDGAARFGMARLAAAPAYLATIRRFRCAPRVHPVTHRSLAPARCPFSWSRRRPNGEPSRCGDVLPSTTVSRTTSDPVGSSRCQDAVCQSPISMHGLGSPPQQATRPSTASFCSSSW